MISISEKTTVPLFAVIGAIGGGAALVAGFLIWVAGISTAASLATAQNSEQDKRIDRQMTAIIELRNIMIDVKTLGERTDAKVDILMKHDDRRK